MVVNQRHVDSLVRQASADESVQQMRARAAELEDYVQRGKTLPDPGTNENVSVETLSEVIRILTERADEMERIAAEGGDPTELTR